MLSLRLLTFVFAKIPLSICIASYANADLHT